MALPPLLPPILSCLISPMTLWTQHSTISSRSASWVSFNFFPSKQPSGLRLASTNCWPNVTAAATFNPSSFVPSIHNSAIFSVLTFGLFFINFCTVGAQHCLCIKSQLQHGDLHHGSFFPASSLQYAITSPHTCGCS